MPTFSSVFSAHTFAKLGGAITKAAAGWLADLDDLVSDTLKLTVSNPTVGDDANRRRGMRALGITYQKSWFMCHQP